MSTRTTVDRDDDQVRVRTPEGQEVLLTPERAFEWCSSRKFLDRLRFAAMGHGRPPADATNGEQQEAD